MINIRHEPSFPFGQTFKVAFGGTGAFVLQNLFQMLISALDVFKVFRVVERIIGTGDYVNYPSVQSQYLIAFRFWGIMPDNKMHRQSALTVGYSYVTEFPAVIPLSCPFWYLYGNLLPPIYCLYGQYMGGFEICTGAVVVSRIQILPEGTMVEFHCLQGFACSPNLLTDKAGWQFWMRFADRIVGQVVQFVLVLDAVLEPRPTSLVICRGGNFESIYDVLIVGDSQIDCPLHNCIFPYNY